MGQMFQITVLGLTAFAHATPETLAAQADRLIGTWALMAASASTGTGAHDSTPYGSRPSGFLTYTPEGRMMAIISYDGGSHCRLPIDMLRR